MTRSRAGLTLDLLRGAEVTAVLPALAALKIDVMQEWPYLHAAHRASEEAALRVYAESPRSVFALARDVDGRIVGAAGGLPLADGDEALRAPFEAAGIDPALVFHLGESALLPALRGLGLGEDFFTAREAHAAALGGFRWTAFCAVDRDERDPRRPAGYRGPEATWAKRGYVRRDDLRCTLGWPEAACGGDVAHRLTFHLRPLGHASARQAGLSGHP